MNTGINQIVFVSDMRPFGFEKDSPAIVHRPSGTMYLNRRIMQNLSPDARFFIMMHEAGHSALADNYAINALLSRGSSRKSIIEAMTEIFKFNKDEDKVRLNNAFSRCIEYEINSGNKTLKNMIFPEQRSIDPRFPGEYISQMSSADGETTQPAPTTEPGSKFGSWLLNIGNGLGTWANAASTVIGALNGTNGQNTVTQPSNLTLPTNTSEKNYLPWIFGGIAVLVVIIVVIIYMKKR